MRGIILIAPPTAGKGTQAELIVEKYKYNHISTGDLLREESKKNTLEGLYISETIESGELVDDDLVFKLLENKLLNIDSKGFILDGFPRDIVQAETLDNLLRKLNIEKLLVILIDIDEDIAKQRILGRMQCPNCKAVYNNLIDSLKPINNGICNICGNQLVKRTDDTEETIKERFESYLKNTEPLISYYENRNLLYKVDGKQDKDNVFHDIEKILGSENYD